MSDKTLREELFDTIHDKRVVLTWLEWENAVTAELLEVVQRRVEEATLRVPQYVFTFEIQVWADSSYQPQKLGTRKPITVIAATGAEAWAEAARILGEPAGGTVRKHALVSATDVRA